MMRSYREALNEAMCEEMRRDSRIFLIGEEVGYYQGAFKVSKGFVEEFGPQRVIDTPITEAGFTGLALGAALAAHPPIHARHAARCEGSAQECDQGPQPRHLHRSAVVVWHEGRGPGG